MGNQVERFLQTKKSRRFVLKSGLYLSGGLILPEFTELPQPPTPILPPPKAPWVEPTNMDEIVAIAARGMSLSEEHVRRIIECESNYDPQAISPDGLAKGIWQIRTEHKDKFEVYNWDYDQDWSNPYRNTRVAIDIRWDPRGLNNWDCK